MFTTEARANDIRQDYYNNGNDSTVEAEIKKVVPYVDANCVIRTYNENGIIEIYDNNKIYKVKPDGTRELIKELSLEDNLENATGEVNEILNEYKYVLQNK